MYLNYAVSKGTGPPSEAVFKQYLRSLEGFVLQMNGMDPQAIDASFVSGRDQEPFVVLYGVAIGEMSGTSAPLVAYEQKGVEGRRLVAYANTKVELVDQARLDQLLAGREKHPPR